MAAFELASSNLDLVPQQVPDLLEQLSESRVGARLQERSAAAGTGTSKIALIRPGWAVKTTTRSAMTNASSIEWVMKTIVFRVCSQIRAPRPAAPVWSVHESTPSRRR